MDKWLKNLAGQHRDLKKNLSDTKVEEDDFFRTFLSLLAEIDQYYMRIFPFQTMFYDFLQNGSRKEYRAAVELLRRISEENKEEEKIIEKARYSWSITSRNVTHNIGRLRLKRYLSVMANRELRKKYFGF